MLDKVGAAHTAYDHPKYYVGEVAPPGWGHTKAEKEKTKPWKPKSKIGGTAAAFKRALDDGRFKGLPGSKTKKEKTADMFKLMWAMKKKGDKPHYKPGTDKKYKKYQEEGLDFKTFYDTAKKAISKKQDERKPQKAQDAGARARRVLQRKEYKSKVSSIVPAELEDHKTWNNFKKHI
jgi:hypothetical protein